MYDIFPSLRFVVRLLFNFSFDFDPDVGLSESRLMILLDRQTDAMWLCRGIQ